MKALWVLAAVAISTSSAWAACPDLGGLFRCQEENGSYDLSIQQTALAGGEASYEFDLNYSSRPNQVVTGGASHKIEYFKGVRDIQYTASCKDRNVIVDLTGDHLKSGGKLSLQFYFFKNDFGDLVAQADGWLKVGQKNHSVYINLYCSKLSRER